MPWSNAQRYGAALPQRRAAVAAAAAAEQTQGPAPASPLLPADSLQQGALPACDSSLAKDVEVDVSGTAHHLGLAMEWRLSFAADGSFVEHLSSPQLSCSCGYDAAASGQDGAERGGGSSGGGRTGTGSSGGNGGGSSGNGSSGGSRSSSRGAPVGASAYFQPRGVCWTSDDGGCPRLLQLDDAEAQLLCMWVRTGLWVLPNISAQLDIARASANEAAACAAAAASSSSDGSLCQDEEARSSSGGSSGGSSREAGGQLGPTVWLKLRLRGGGKLTALVEVVEADWRPLSVRLCLAGEHEVWTFSDWHQWQPGLWLAGGAVQSTTGEGGVVNDYALAAVQVRSAAASTAGSSADGGGYGGSGDNDSSGSSNSSSSVTGGRRFAQPPAPLLPPGSSFVPGLPEEVPAWHTTSGHSLVRPLLNGREVGYFILDTGASGFVLDRAAGDALGLEAFGELQVTSIIGRIASRYRRADTFQLGPLRMARPLLMELPMAGLVTGVPDGGRVVGIVGYDVLRRAVVHVPAPPRRPAPAAVTGATVDSPAAAVAASVAASKLLRGALPLTLRFQHPEALEQSSSSSSSSMAAGLDDPSRTACTAAAGPTSSTAAAAAAALGSPEARAAEALGVIDSSISRSDSSSNRSDQQTAALPASCLLTTHGIEAALAAELAVAAAGSTAGAEDAAAAAAAVAAVPAASRAGGAPADGPVGQEEWLPVVMVASLPHIELELVTAEGRRHRGLFMVDSGAGGLDIVLNFRAAQALGLGKGSTATHIKGLGGGGGASRMPARRCQLDQVWLGPHSFSGVQALYREGPGGSGGLELSQHTSGIVCGGVLGRCTLVFDYPRMRLAVRRPAAAAVLVAAAV